MSFVPDDDRGLHYGDGLFETIRFAAGFAPFWPWHMERLRTGCGRLLLPLPDLDALAETARATAAQHAHAVLKIVLTAGSGPRGYARPSPLLPRLIVQAQAFAPQPSTDLALRWCVTRCAVQPRLAGIKHLNRIENVLARSEWAQEVDEGLMLDSRGRVVGATAANLFVRSGDCWLTPAVDRCGIAGIGRRWLMGKLQAEVGELTRKHVHDSQECVLINAIRGPRAAVSLGTKTWSVSARMRALQADWADQFTSGQGLVR